MGEHAPSSRDGLALPHSAEAEREVLGAALVEPALLDSILELVQPEDFYFERHAAVLEAMRRVAERHGTFDVVTLTQELRDAGVWDRIGGASTLGALLERAGTTSMAEHYADTVRKKAVARRVIEASRDIEAQGLEGGDIGELLEEAERRVLEVIDRGRGAETVLDLKQSMLAAITGIEAAHASGSGITGITTGFRDLDKLTHGLHGGDLIVLAARPAMGKTALALGIGINAALRAGAAVAVFSLEMPDRQLSARLLAAEARIDLERLMGGQLDQMEWPRLLAAADRLQPAQLMYAQPRPAKLSAVRSICRRMRRRGRLDLVIIDYLQLMSGDAGGRQPREQEVASISRGLKELALELGIPVIALSQLNRSLETRADKRPMLSDLRESGAIEQDADLVAFLYRDEVYNKAVGEDERGTAELIIGKHRNGRTGVVRLKFWSAYTRFDSLAYH